MTRLLGTVTLHGGEKAAQTATVEISNSGGDVVDQVMVDDDGKFTYHLAPGSWSVRVWDAHGHRAKLDVTLTEGEDTSVDIDLEEPEGGH